MLQVQSAIGLVVLLLIAWGVSEERRIGAWRIALTGIALQLVLAAAMLKVPPIAAAVGAINGLVAALEAATAAGTSLVFGFLGGAPLPFEETQPGASFVLAFRALPVIIVVGALSALLTYWRILPLVVRGFGYVLERSFRLGGAVGLASAANIFIGMVEAPLFVRPYLNRLSRSELFVLMATGMATIAGTVFVLYSIILSPVMPDAASQLLVASVISAPAAITIALLMVPPDGPPLEGAVELPREDDGAMEAIVRGTDQGLKVFLSVVATLVVAVALVHLVNAVLGLLPEPRERPVDPPADLLLATHPGRLVARGPVVRSAERGRRSRDEDRPQRVRRLSRAGRPPARGALAAEPARTRLRRVRLRQLRESRHHDRRPRRDGPGTARGDRGPRHEEHRGGGPRDLRHRLRRGDPDPGRLTGAGAVSQRGGRPLIPGCRRPTDGLRRATAYRFTRDPARHAGIG